MGTAAVDNDVLYKGAWYGLIRELVGAIPAAPGEAFILGEARFVIRKRLEKDLRKGTPDAERALNHFEAMLVQLTQAEPSLDEQLLAADIENAAQAAGLALDVGESILSAVTISRGLARLATGDKRAICALEVLSRELAQLNHLVGRIACLEQLFSRALVAAEPAKIRTAVCGAQQVDKAITACFSCSSTAAADVEGWCSALASYINHLRRAAPSMLEAC